MQMRKIAILACWVALQAHAGTLYKVVGADGKITYTDRPQPAGKVTAVGAGAQAEGAGASGAADPAQRLVMFSTEGCDYCRQAKQYLRAKGIAFDERDIGHDSSAAQEFRRLGGRGVPLFVYKGRTMSGYSPQGLDNLLRL